MGIRVDSFETAVAEVQRRFRCVPREPGRDPATSPTGRQYREILTGVDERAVDGRTLQAVYFSERHAAQAWFDEIMRLGAGKSVIYWRIEPELDRRGPKVWTEEIPDFAFGASVLVGRDTVRIYSRQDFE